MGKVIQKKIQGMSLWAKVSLITTITLLVSVFMYQGWYKPAATPAAPTISNAWTNVYAATANSTGINVNSSAFTVNAGTNRLLLVAVQYESGTAGTFSAHTVTYGTATVTPIATTGGTSSRSHTWLGYVLNANIPTGSNAVNVTATSSQALSGVQIAVASYTGVNQATPITSSAQRITTTTTVAFPSAISYNADSITIIASSNGGSAPTFGMTGLTGGSAFTSQAAATSTTGGFAGFVAVSGTNASAGSYTTANTVSYGGSTSTRSSLVVASLNPSIADTTPPTVTINQAAAQADPTSASPINFTVVFSEATTTFATGDVTIGGTAGGTKTATVTGSGTTYNVAVTGMTTAGTVTATIAAGVATDAAGNGNTASTSTDNSVSWTVADTTPPTVTINQAAAQADPTSASPINFTVVFSEATTTFVTGDVTIGGTAGGTKTATVTGSGTTYNVAVTGMTTAGTVTATIAAGVATDAAGNGNTASTSTDNSVSWTVADTTPPTVTINQAAAQADPTSASPINFTVVFSEATTTFATGDVTIGGTAGGTKTATVTGSGTTYNVAVTGMTTAGTVTVTIAAGVATDAAGNGNTASTSTDNSVSWTVAAVPGTIALSAATYSIGEAGGTVTITATRTGGSTGAVGISYATSNGTATAGSDYTAATGTLSWATGDAANKTFIVTIANDVITEANETFNVTLSAPTGGATLGSPATAVVTIVDNDGAVVSPLMHNSANLGTAKGTWGTTFNCETCHSRTTSNVKRIAPQISTPNGLRNVTFTRLTASRSNNVATGVFGNDTRTFSTNTSNLVCSVCHHNTTHHQYSSSKSTSPNHYNNQNCTSSCHLHKLAFAKPSGVASHTPVYPGATHMADVSAGSYGNCTVCHAVTAGGVYPDTTIGNPPNCTGCHINAANFNTASAGCADCHGTNADGRPNGATFPNNQRSHAVVGHVLACNTCHNGGGTGTLTHGNSNHIVKTQANVLVSLTSGTFNAGTLACSATTCHGAGVPIWGGTLAGTGCDKCHTATAGASFMLTDRTTGTNKSVIHVSHVNRTHAIMTSGTGAVVCASCHTVPATADAAGHFNTALPAEVVASYSLPGGGPFSLTYTGTYPTATCNTYCHGTTLASNASPPAGVVLAPTFGTTLLTGTASNDCGKCHGYPPQTSDHVKTAPSTYYGPTECKGCHPHVNAAGTGFDNVAIHIDGKVDAAGGDCTGCHASVQGGRRIAVMGQFTGSRNSHHYQGTAKITKTVCYACHWEADATGAKTTHHQEQTAGFKNKVQLVNWSSATTRPTTYSASTYVLYSSGGTNSSSRTELAKINRHCIGCHKTTNNAIAPFATDSGTPSKYSWEALPANKGGLAGAAQSIAAKYSDMTTTLWGKFTGNYTNAKSSQTKALSAHGNAGVNQRGWSTLMENAQGAAVANYPNTSGVVQVLCFDCHNSHGSESSAPANAVTTSYSSATGRGRGGILKTTVAGQGGYTVSYRPYTGGNATQKSAYKTGAGLCFDCHNNATVGLATSAGFSTPWGYTATFNSTAKIHGYNDNPYFGKAGGTFAKGTTYPYIGTGLATNKGGHFGASTALTTATNNGMKIGGLCTPCHDPHGVSLGILAANRQYAVPMLKETFVTSPYKQDAAAVNAGHGGGRDLTPFATAATAGYHIDQNTLQTATTGSPTTALKWNFATSAATLNTLTDAQFAGLCLKCHSKTVLNSTAAATSANWKTMTRIHNAVKGWASTGGGNAGNTKHAYTCSKCHSSHNSNLPRLLVTNCLDSNHKNRVASGGAATIGPYSGSTSSGNGLGRFPGGGAAAATGGRASSPGPWFFGTSGTAATQACHDSATAGGTTFSQTSQQWNTKSLW